MIYSKIQEMGELESIIEEVLDMVTSEHYIILRAPRRIYYFDRVTLKEISRINIPIDNSFGSKEIVTINDFCYTPVFPKQDPNFPSEAMHDYAELNAYSKDGLIWSYPLKGWKSIYNAGGIFTIKDRVIVSVKSDDLKAFVFLDPSTGKEIERIEGVDPEKTGASIITPVKNFATRSQLGYIEFEKECFTIIDFSKNEPVSTELPSSIVQMVTLSQDYFFLFHIEERQFLKLSQFTLSDLELLEEYSLEIDFRPYRMLSNEAGNLIVFMDKEGCSFHCFSTESNSIVWVWKSEYTKNPIHFIFDKTDNLIVLDGDSVTNRHLIILDGNTGNQVQNLQGLLGEVHNAFPFLIDDRILVAVKGKLIALSRAEQA